MNHIPSWLHEAIFYEIYPQSFFDTNADGIGDLEGIIEKLPYVKALGCNAIWLNPCFASSFQDAGYDVTDFYQIAPRYGTNEDARRLFQRAKELGLRVVLDLVAGHMSIDSPMFRRSAEPAPNEYSNRFIWTDNAWESSDRFDVVKGFSDRDGGYVTNFFYMQAALNYGFENPEPGKAWQLPVDHPDCVATKEMLKDVMRFWTEMGADGFRVDMAHSLVKNDPHSIGTKRLWQDIISWYEEAYPEHVLISEWSNPRTSIDAGFHVDFLIHFNTQAYTSLFRAEETGGHSFFSPEGCGDITVFTREFEDILRSIQGRGFVSVPSGNHDMLRLSRGRSMEDLKVAFACLCTLPGVPFIYYGDEIGMNNNMEVHSKEGGYSRTPARTPMQWNDGPNAGFSDAAASQLYLPIGKGLEERNVAHQQAQPDSLYHFVQHLLFLRRKTPALQNAAGYRTCHAVPGSTLYVYERYSGDDRILIAVNPAKAERSCTFPLDASRIQPLDSDKCCVCMDGGMCTVTAGGIGYGIFRIVT